MAMNGNSRIGSR